MTEKLTEQELQDSRETEERAKQSKILEMQMLLSQNDYMARKVAFEVAETIKKLFPDVSMPEYEKYKEREAQAKEFRKVVDELQDS